MSKATQIAEWLETRWVTPSYSGWLLGGLFIFFFISATNTLAGWLYVLSGVGIALLAIAAILPERILRNIQVHRNPIYPVSVGDNLTIELVLENPTAQPKTLIQIQDMLPYVLGQPVTKVVETIPPHGNYHWVYFQPTQRRGIYRWQTVNLRTAAPLGLFWCRRSRVEPSKAVVYPTVLPLTHCPLIDEMGIEASLQFNSDRRTQTATEGITRSLRPYRWGDPTRLVHWRTSARYGELRVRELEVLTGGHELVICLDSALPWRDKTQSPGIPSEDFEQAVIAAASLYFYALHLEISVKLWTAGAGLVRGSQAVLETLAAVQPGEDIYAENLPSSPLLWLTQNPTGLHTLPPGSRWILWPSAQEPNRQSIESTPLPFVQNTPGITINPNQPLQLQLQGPLK
ncbi:MAG: DUF58 domain-containing protein [Leptolyngbyaceae cyanobacterium HOT.MB2.61]|nr:DUF58 domain-containing protein [Leptolyngbyaceae cyanobacterium HOT.MB2.61]